MKNLDAAPGLSIRSSHTSHGTLKGARPVKSNNSEGRSHMCEFDKSSRIVYASYKRSGLCSLFLRYITHHIANGIRP